MITRTGLITLPLIAALAACSSSGGGGDNPTDDPIVSSGIFDVELPNSNDLAGLPQEVQDTVTAFQTLNEGDLADPITSGAATYTGIVGFGVFEENSDVDSALVFGEATINADFDALTVDGSFDNLIAFDPENNNAELGALTGSLGISNGVITDSSYTADFGGDLTLDTETFGVGGVIDGAFVGDGTDSIGLLDGTVTNPDSTVDLLSGLFVVSSD